MRSIVLVLALAGNAYGWDGPELWFAEPTGANPGGGGMFGTGSARDYTITCKHCHVEEDESATIAFTLTFSPALGPGDSYAPGQTYAITARLTGEFLGLSGCDPLVENHNGFAATFEDGQGRNVGVLRSDSGQVQTSCPAAWPFDGVMGANTTGLYGDCEVIFGVGDNRTQWAFQWTAPASGTGPVTIYYGTTDGDCDMMSMGDRSIDGKRVLAEASARRDPRLPWVFLVPAIVLVARRRR